MHDLATKLAEVRGALPSVFGFAGAGFGLKETAGKRQQQLAWRIYVSRKVPRKRLPQAGLVPPMLLGLPTDVIERKPTFATSAYLGAIEGAMIANRKGVPGTLGCWAWLAGTGEPVLLSNYHVLFGKRCQPGDVIWRVRHQRSRNHFKSIGKSLAGKAATVSYRGSGYFIDAAIGAGDNSARAEGSADDLPVPCSGAGNAILGSLVSKRGAATQQTFGTIVDICYPDQWHYDLEAAAAPNQLLIQPESQGPDQRTEAFSGVGDSGAVIREDSGRVVGLLWGSNARGEGVACHIGPVMKELGIRFEPPEDPRVTP